MVTQSANAGDAEVVPEHGNFCFSHVANDRLHVFNVPRPLRSIQKNFMPVRRIEIFNASENQPRIFDFLAQLFQFRNRPKLFRIARNSPGLIFAAGGLILSGIVRALLEIIHQMDDDMRTSSLTREVVIFVRQHVPVQTQPHLHKRFPILLVSSDLGFIRGDSLPRNIPTMRTTTHFSFRTINSNPRGGRGFDIFSFPSRPIFSSTSARF